MADKFPIVSHAVSAKTVFVVTRYTARENTGALENIGEFETREEAEAYIAAVEPRKPVVEDMPEPIGTVQEQARALLGGPSCAFVAEAHGYVGPIGPEGPEGAIEEPVGRGESRFVWSTEVSEGRG